MKIVKARFMYSENTRELIPTMDIPVYFFELEFEDGEKKECKTTTAYSATAIKDKEIIFDNNGMFYVKKQ